MTDPIIITNDDGTTTVFGSVSGDINTGDEPQVNVTDDW